MKRLLIIAGVLGLIAVAFGALGAHALKNIITAQQLEIFEKGVRYQFYHTLAIIAVALAFGQTGQKHFYYAGNLFLWGIICFSGSLYLLALQTVNISDTLILSNLVPTKVIGPVTPIGGLLFIAGWLMLLRGASKLKP